MILNDDKHSLLNMAILIDDWKQKYHSDQKDNIIFQCRKLLTNVILPVNFLHAGHSVASRGFVNLPGTIIDPSEVWAKWKDTKSQRDVLRNYLLIGDNGSYIVQTDKGKVTKAFFVQLSRIDRYRRGLIIYCK